MAQINLSYLVFYESVGALEFPIEREDREKGLSEETARQN